MSNHERITDVDPTNHDITLPWLPWWHDLPQDKPITIIITGKRLPLEGSLSIGERQSQAVSNGQRIVQTIYDYMTSSDLFQDFDPEKINKLDALGILIMSATPQQCDALMQCGSVEYIIPNIELDLIKPL